MKRLIAAAVLAFLAVACTAPASAARCWLQDEAEDVDLPPGAKLQTGGYLCLDHWRAYFELEGGLELVTARPNARYFPSYIQPQPADRPRRR